MSVENINVLKLREEIEKLTISRTKIGTFLDSIKLAKKEYKVQKKAAKKSNVNFDNEKEQMKILKKDAKVAKGIVKLIETKIKSANIVLRAIENQHFQRMWNTEDANQLNEVLSMIENRKNRHNVSNENVQKSIEPTNTNVQVENQQPSVPTEQEDQDR